MSAEASLPLGVEVVRATAEQAPVLANLLELYSHDFSEIVELRLGPDGRFGYPDLPLYWREEGRHPFLVRVDGHLAGFALVSRGSRITLDPRTWDMTEFFVARGYRKRGIGAAVAGEIWRRFPGAWDVRVLEANRPARAFWRSAIGAFTGAPAESILTELNGRRWEVFSFVSPKGGQMSALTADDLLRFATTLEGEPLTTLERRARFTVHVVPAGLEITPASSGKTRLVSREIVQRVCDEFERSRSERPGHYQEITFDASYLLAIIDRYRRAESGSS